MKKALVVGIDCYPGAPLHGCCNDASSMEKVLSENADGSPNFAVKTVKNVADKSELRALVEECFAGDADVALLYYSGHGYVDSVGGYLVTTDYTQHDPGLSLSAILTIANSSKCKERIIILDSCYSGLMGNIQAGNKSTTTYISEGVTILTSSRSAETSAEINGHGLFTALLLEALAGGAADITGYITPGGVYAYIDKALGPWDQRPVFKTNVTRFTSLRRVIPQIDISILRKICIYFNDEDTELSIDPSFEPTNHPSVPHEVIEPYAIPKNTKIFSDLQKLEGVGLVVPIDEDHMKLEIVELQSTHLRSLLECF